MTDSKLHCHTKRKLDMESHAEKFLANTFLIQVHRLKIKLSLNFESPPYKWLFLFVCLWFNFTCVFPLFAVIVGTSWTL